MPGCAAAPLRGSGVSGGESRRVVEVAHITAARLRDETFSRLLHIAYEEKYLKYFKEAKDYESEEKFRDIIGGRFHGVDGAFYVAGYNLRDSAQASVTSFGVGYYYNIQKEALLAFNVSEEKGQGKLMVKVRMDGLQDLAHADGKHLSHVFVEVADPCEIPDTPQYARKREEAILREAKFSHMGAVPIDITYWQPVDDGRHNRQSRLHAYSTDGQATHPHPEEVKGFLRGINRELRSGYNHAADPYYRRQAKDLDIAWNYGPRPAKRTPEELLRYRSNLVPHRFI